MGHTVLQPFFRRKKKEPETSSQDSWEYVKFTACLHTHLKRCYQPACNICLNQQNHNSSYFIAFLLAIDCFKVIRAEIVEEEPFEESIPHPKTLVGWLIVNYVNNEVYPKMDLRTNFTMKTTSYQNHIHKNSSIHPYFRQLRHILELKNKKMKKITQKKSSLFSILFFLELLSENPEDPTPSRTQPIQTQTFHSLLFSGSVLPLAIGANLSLLKNFVDFRKIEFRWWVGIDKLG